MSAERRFADRGKRLMPRSFRNFIHRKPLPLVHIRSTPRYLTRHGTPSTVADLAARSLIGFDVPTEFLRNASKTLLGWRREAFAMRTDSDLAQLALIRSGAGISVCQVPVARRDDAMVRVLPKQFSLPLETWISMHEACAAVHAAG